MAAIYARSGPRYVHRAMAERALGRPLPPGAQVHHVDRQPKHNTPENFVVCDHAYHMVLHQRERAFRACGNPGWRRCNICKQYDAPENLYLHPSKRQTAFHRSCATAADRARKGGSTCRA